MGLQPVAALLLSGFSVFGISSYSVATDNNGGTLTASGAGSVTTPMVVEISTVTEVYKLMPTDPAGRHHDCGHTRRVYWRTTEPIPRTPR